ncbi:hypothetical protein FNV43_RR07363 [Rhamnella rubrinervis]|uniref:Ubiquitin-like protease family profile domain-containing protein n=1 Tax=Rhamnella rubrinervis TaxID=2594499 RepID=A0A8K0MMM6_9ROSA|nr:hypothetical protein FNV43_RR07363 [Rhamnella rubrinervis]
MAPLKRLRKASDKSTEATTVTKVAATKKRSREVEESSNALQVSRRIIPEGAGDNAHLTVISNCKWHSKLSLISYEGIDQFEASIFGDFTRMKATILWWICAPLLLRQLYNDDPHVIEFEFNGVGARFDRKAFAMFTGLNCGKFPKETEMRNLSYNLWTNLRSKMEAGKHKTSYSLYGFPLAFQMWGFHVIPMVPTMTSLGAFLGVRYPRMLGYQFSNILHYNRLANDVFNKKQQIVAYTPPPPSPAQEQEPHHPIHASMQGRYNKHVVRDPHVDEDMEQFEQNIDWASEMNDPSNEYYREKCLESSSSRTFRHITLYDSAIKMTPKSWFQIKNARPLVVLFPYLLMVNEYYTHHPDQTLDLTPFRMTREEDSSLPQQISDGDCGVYALKYIEYLIAGRPFDFNSSHIALFREKYAVEIFHNEM